MTPSARRIVIGMSVAVAALDGAIFLAASPAGAHPLHTSLAEVVHEPSTGTVRISLRVFVDDFTSASLAHTRWRLSKQPAAAVPPSQSPYVTYALAAFRMTDSGGRKVPLTSCGGRRSGELMWLCFRGPAPRALSGFSVTSHVMFDLHRDQINIVQASYGGRKASLLFTRGDGAKKLP